MKKTPTELLVKKLCIELGFCLSPVERSRLLASPPTTVKAFTDAVFIAEGLDPDIASKRLWRQVRDRVTNHFQNIENDLSVSTQGTN